MKNKKLIFITVSILLLAVASQYGANKNTTQTVVPNLLDEGCFEKADCFAPIKQGYCNIRFDCIQGKCARENVLCPEICDSGKDEDLDKKIDCSDSDCWSSPLCSCEIASFNVCQAGTCWCPEGKSSRWFVGDTNYCTCT